MGEKIWFLSIGCNTNYFGGALIYNEKWHINQLIFCLSRSGNFHFVWSVLGRHLSCDKIQSWASRLSGLKVAVRGNGLNCCGWLTLPFDGVKLFLVFLSLRHLLSFGQDTVVIWLYVLKNSGKRKLLLAKLIQSSRRGPSVLYANSVFAFPTLIYQASVCNVQLL